MNLEQQCISLDLGKRLKELKIPQESLFYWADASLVISEPMDILIADNKTRSLSGVNNSWPDEDNFEVCSAFTAGELLQLLPYHILSKEPEPFNSYRLYISGSVIVKNPECIDPVRTHIVNYKTDTYDMNSCTLAVDKSLTQNIWDENPANALAKMLVYLHETGLLKND